ncbi:unnamed protein product, partial [Effrenium voratum]
DRSHIPCRQFQKGHCVFGDRCRYGHDGEPGEAQGSDAITIPMASVHVVKRQQLSYEEAAEMLQTAETDCMQ